MPPHLTDHFSSNTRFTLDKGLAKKINKNLNCDSFSFRSRQWEQGAWGNQFSILPVVNSINFLHSQKERKTSNLENLGKRGRKGRGRWSVLKFQYFLYTVNSIGQNELSIPKILIGHKTRRAVHESPIRGHALYIYIVDFEFLKNWKLFPIKIFFKSILKIKKWKVRRWQ